MPDTGGQQRRGRSRGGRGRASPGSSGEGKPDLDGDFGPLFLLIGRGGTRQQQEEDGAHDEGGDEQHLHVPLGEAQHPPGRASAAGQPRAGRGWGHGGAGGTARGRGGEDGAPAGLLEEGGPEFPPLGRRRIVGPPGGVARLAQGAGGDAGSWVAATLLRPHRLPRSPRPQQEGDQRKAVPLQGPRGLAL